MILTSSALMRKADSAAINDCGISSVLLMENAAKSLAGRAFSYCAVGKRAIAFCGSGNNGGDGVAASRFLAEKGCEVTAVLVGSREKMTADTREMESRLNARGISLVDFAQAKEKLLREISSASVIIDALFGIGFSRKISGEALEAVRMMNASGVPIVSADIASGVAADTGEVSGEAVMAAETVTFSLAKPGHFVEPGCIYCGGLSVCDIGIPQELADASKTPAFAMCDGEMTLPRRPKISHKGDYGKLLILGGCVGYTGAPSLAARAAVRAGAGLVYLGVPKSIYEITAVKNDEAMPFCLAEDDFGRLSKDALPVIKNRAEDCGVCVVGCGMGRSGDTVALVQAMIADCGKPMVIDADGLYALSQDMSVMKKAVKPLVLTPHEGEFARMGGRLTGDRIADARSFAQKYDCVLVLKGHRTMVTYPDGEVYITTHGNPGMAKGGTGDTLAGIIGAMMGQLPLKRAVNTAVFLHSLAGDLCRDSLGEYAMTAGDLIETLPQALKIMTGE